MSVTWLEIKDSNFYRYFPADGRVPDNLPAAFADHAGSCDAFLARIPEEKADFRYAPGKWSIKQVVGHVTDTSFVFLYRLVVISRGETQPLPGFDENEYMAKSAFDGMSWGAVLEAHRGVARAASGLIAGIHGDSWTRSGFAAGTRLTAGDLLTALIGHERHHLGVLKERYGVS